MWCNGGGLDRVNLCHLMKVSTLTVSQYSTLRLSIAASSGRLSSCSKASPPKDLGDGR
jgi:hypothetical protein